MCISFLCTCHSELIFCGSYFRDKSQPECGFKLVEDESVCVGDGWLCSDAKTAIGDRWQLSTIYYNMFYYVYHPYSNCNHVCLDYLSTQKNVPNTIGKPIPLAQVVREKMMDFEVPRDLCALEERELGGWSYNRYRGNYTKNILHWLHRVLK